MTYALSAVGFTAGSIAALTLLVHLIDRLDKWGRRHGLTIVVPEQRDPSNVTVLADRRSA